MSSTVIARPTVAASTAADSDIDMTTDATAAPAATTVNRNDNVSVGVRACPPRVSRAGSMNSAVVSDDASVPDGTAVCRVPASVTDDLDELFAVFDG